MKKSVYRSLTVMTLAGLLLTGCTATSPNNDSSNGGASASSTVAPVSQLSEAEVLKTFNTNLTSVFNSEIYQELLAGYDEVSSLDDPAEAYAALVEQYDHLGENVNVIPVPAVQYNEDSLKYGYTTIVSSAVSELPENVNSETMNKAMHVLNLASYATYAQTIASTLAERDGVAIEDLSFGADSGYQVKVVEGQSKDKDGLKYVSGYALYVEAKGEQNQNLVVNGAFNTITVYTDDKGVNILDLSGEGAPRINRATYIDQLVDMEALEHTSFVMNEIANNNLEFEPKVIKELVDGQTFESAADTKFAVEEKGGEIFLTGQNPEGGVTAEKYYYPFNAMNAETASSVGRYDFKVDKQNVGRLDFISNFLGSTLLTGIFDAENGFNVKDFNTFAHDSAKEISGDKELSDALLAGYHKKDKYSAKRLSDTAYVVAIDVSSGLFEDSDLTYIVSIEDDFAAEPVEEDIITSEDIVQEEMSDEEPVG